MRIDVLATPALWSGKSEHILEDDDDKQLGVSSLSAC